MILAVAILVCFAIVGLACYDAGRLDGLDKAEDEARTSRALQYALDVEAGRNRHPSGR